MVCELAHVDVPLMRILEESNRIPSVQIRHKHVARHARSNEARVIHVAVDAVCVLELSVSVFLLEFCFVVSMEQHRPSRVG